MKKISSLAMVLVLLGVAVVYGGERNSSASSSIPHLINYQGVLTTPAGTPVLDGTYDILFSIYDAAQGGNLEWDHTYSVTVTKGLFNIILGESEPIDLPFDEDYWLEIKVGNDPPLSPRIRITSVGYAYRAEVANTAVVARSGGGWADDGTVVRLETKTDNVGIGTSNPSAGLHVHSDTSQGQIVVSGASDDGLTYSALYLNGDTHDKAQNSWVIGHKKRTGSPLEEALQFFKYANGDGKTAMVIQPSGNVSLGGDLTVDGWSITLNGGDFNIREPSRGPGGRALVHWENNELILNFDGDFTGGTRVMGPKLTVNGNVLLQSPSSGAIIMELGEGLDYAEGFDVSDHQDIAPGAVLIIDPSNPGKLVISSQPYDKRVAGIVAGANGTGSGVRLGADQFDYDVALAGRVYCNVDATGSGVEPGDLLTTSTAPGHAMKVMDQMSAQGAILGKAMQKLEQGQKGQILVLVTLQ